MDKFKRMSSGRLSELTGTETLELDKYLRILGFRHKAEKLIPKETEEERAIV